MKSYETFINELKSYNDYVYEYAELKSKINELWYKLGGVKAADPSKISIRGYNKLHMELCKLEDYDRIENMQKEMQRLKVQIDHVNLILNEMSEDIRNVFMDIYFSKVSFEKVARKRIKSVGSLRYEMKKEYEEVICKLA